MYHPPDADQLRMREYLIISLDNILRRHPECGVILTGDFNQLKDNFIFSHYGYKQLVKNPTRKEAIWDKIWSNMAQDYDPPVVLSELGTSDHNMVLFSSTSHPLLILVQSSGCMGHNENVVFATELSSVRWEPMYSLCSCEEQLTYYQAVMNTLIEYCFPQKQTSSGTRSTGKHPDCGTSSISLR